MTPCFYRHQKQNTRETVALHYTITLDVVYAYKLRGRYYY